MLQTRFGDVVSNKLTRLGLDGGNKVGSLISGFNKNTEHSDKNSHGSLGM